MKHICFHMQNTAVYSRGWISSQAAFLRMETIVI